MRIRRDKITPPCRLNQVFCCRIRDFPVRLPRGLYGRPCYGAALFVTGSVRADVPPADVMVDTPPQVVFEVVLAEIALKRDKPQVALAAYADLALKYNDPDIFRRTMEIAALNRQPDLMLEAGRLWVQKEPDNIEALNLLASTQILLGRYGEAQPTLQRYFEKLSPERRAPELPAFGATLSGTGRSPARTGAGRRRDATLPHDARGTVGAGSGCVAGWR